MRPILADVCESEDCPLLLEVPEVSNMREVFGEVKPVVAGVTGGVLSTLALHPLDNIKIRCAAGRGSCASQFSSILRGPLGVRGFYQGIQPNITLSAVSWGTYFLTYEWSKKRLSSSSGELSPLCQVLAALEAGTITMVISNPLQVLRTRMVLSSPSPSTSTSSTAMAPASTISTAAAILQREGLGALFRGFSPNLIGVTHGTVQMALYDQLKHRYKAFVGREDLWTREHVLLAALSKMVACFTTYPCQVVRTVLQCDPVGGEVPSVRAVVRELWERQGLRAFYRGLTPHLLHVTPNVCIIFAVYEAVMKL